MLVLKEVELAECLVLSSHVPALKQEAKHIYNPKVALSAASQNKQTAVSR